MPMVIGTQAAVAGDGQKQPMALSDPSKMGLKPDMDHTRWVNRARTKIKASARILKQSDGSKEGALE